MVVAAAIGAAGWVPASHAAAPLEPKAAAEKAVDPQFERDFMAAIGDGKFEMANAMANSLRPAAEANPQLEPLVGYFKTLALIGLKPEAEARAAVQSANLDSWNDPYPFISLISVSMQVRKYGIALNALDRIIARFPDALRSDLNEDGVFFLLRKAPADEKIANEDRRIALARISYGGHDAQFLRLQAARYLIERGEVADAVSIAQEVTDPTVFEQMLVTRRYAPLWPQLANAGGPRLERVRAEDVRVANLAYLARPDDMKAISTYARALRRAGRYDEAIDLRRHLPASKDSMAKAGEETGWAVNEIAYALSQSGAWKDADALFALLNSSVTEQSWLISMEINRAEMLVSDKRDKEAWPLIAQLEDSVKVNGNDYARQLVRRIRYCLTARSADRATLSAQRVVLLEHRSDSFEATASALMCDSDWAGAEAVVLEGLKTDEDFRTQFVINSQRRPLTGNDPSRWTGNWLELRQRPAIAAEFERLGRDLPEDLLPPQSALVQADRN